MKTYVKLFSNKVGEISKFLNSFYDYNTLQSNYSDELLEWKKEFENPVEMCNIIGTFIDNTEKFKINMWICIDEGLLINVTNNNVNDIIKYLYERFPY